MRLLILGASGSCGRWLTRLATERGHEVTVLIRPSATFDPSPRVRVVRGEVLEPDVLRDVLPGHGAVASCLGLRRAGRTPWAPLRSPTDLTTRVARMLVPAMERAGIRRVVVISAAGVGESVGNLTRPVRWLVSRGNIAVAYADLARMEDVLAASTLDWLAVRPVTLTNGPPTGRVAPVTRYTVRSTVRRADVGAWMLAALERSEPYREHTVLLG